MPATAKQLRETLEMVSGIHREYGILSVENQPISEELSNKAKAVGSALALAFMQVSNSNQTTGEKYTMGVLISPAIMEFCRLSNWIGEHLLDDDVDFEQFKSRELVSQHIETIVDNYIDLAEENGIVIDKS